VGDHGPVAEFDERFGEGEGERAQAGAEAADEDESCIIFSLICIVVVVVVVVVVSVYLSSSQATTNVKCQVSSVEFRRRASSNSLNSSNDAASEWERSCGGVQDLNVLE
jgi:hypothetical protein